MDQTKEPLDSPLAAPAHPHWSAWSLLAIPPLLSAATVTLVDAVPAGPYFALLQLALVSVIPLGLGWGCAMLIAQYLCGSRWLARFAVNAGELFLILMAWGSILPLYMTSWH